MSTYQFAKIPTTSSVAAAVTFGVCAWFVAAMGMMILDTPGPHVSAGEAASSVVYAAPAVAIAPEARLIIVVEGRRA